MSRLPQTAGARASAWPGPAIVLLVGLLGPRPAALAEPAASDLGKFQATERHMGTDFTVTLYAPSEKTANEAFRAAFARVHALDLTLSDYNEDSELSRLSAAAPTPAPIPVSADLWQALERSRYFFELTGGAFDITIGPCTRLWRRSRRQRELPTDELLAQARAAVGSQHLRLHPASRSAELLRPRMRLDAGGIGQGLAADAALLELRKLGVTRAIVNASGDIVAGDPPPDATGWKVGIAPLDPQAPPSRFLLLANRSVSTSGDAFQFVEIGGRRYSHIVDPRTGLGVTMRCSVSVIAGDCTTADALATALCVLGPEAGMRLAGKLPDVQVLYVYQQDGQTKTIATDGFGS